MLKFPSLLLSQESRTEGEKKSKNKLENENMEFMRFFHQIHVSQTFEKTSNHKFITFIKTYQVRFIEISFFPKFDSNMK
jgi:hypothetical protein